MQDILMDADQQSRRHRVPSPVQSRIQRSDYPALRAEITFPALPGWRQDF